MTRGITLFHAYVAEQHETKPPPAVQYAYSCVTYTTGYKGVTDCEWIIPGSLEQAELFRARLARLRADPSEFKA